MYLRPWLLLGVLGLDQSHTVALSIVLVVSLFVSLCILVGRVPAGTGFLLALAACSPAVMLAVERANMDIALFSFWRPPRSCGARSPVLPGSFRRWRC